jgi:hypothetical protein
VGDKSASLNGEDKLFGRSFIPTLKDLFLRKAIKGHIQFYRVVIFSVELKPLFLWKVRWIKGPIPPMGIVITACTNVNHLMNFKFWIAPACRRQGIRIAEFAKPIWLNTKYQAPNPKQIHLPTVGRNDQNSKFPTKSF